MTTATLPAQITKTTFSSSEDSDALAQCEKALLNGPDNEFTRGFKVEVVGGVAKLSGTADTFYKKQKAQTALKKLHDENQIANIDNQIEVEYQRLNRRF